MKKATLLLLCIFGMLPVFGQAPKNLDEKLFEELHGHGSFNVVFVVLLIILLGVLFSIWRLDRKVNKLMNEIKK